MQILIAGLIAALALLVLPKILGRRQERMLKQYHDLEKHFGLSRRVSQSRWGKGIGERYSLHGERRGYPMSLYSHFVEKQKKRTEWTSLVFEALFVDEVEFSILFSGTEHESLFEKSDEYTVLLEHQGVGLNSTEDLREVWFDESVMRRMAFLAKQTTCGCIRLSKGFLEYREIGIMQGDEQRLRFQEAILLMASLLDALSLYMSKRGRSLLLQVGQSREGFSWRVTS